MSVFKNPDKAQLTSAMRLRLNDMSPLMDLIVGTLDEQKGLLVRAKEPVDIYRLQGKAQVLQDLLDLAEAADKIYAKLK